jgi:DNA-binding CsgD family transcriptional regulator
VIATDPTTQTRPTRRSIRHSPRTHATVRDQLGDGVYDITYSGRTTAGWDSEVALWELFVTTQVDLGEFAILLSPEVYAAKVDVEDTEAGRSVGPEPTYPPPIVEKPHWREDPALLPHLARYPALLSLLESEEGVDAVYRWAGARKREADAYALSIAGLTDEAIAEQLKIALPTVTEFIGRVKWRLEAALRHLDLVRGTPPRSGCAS